MLSNLWQTTVQFPFAVNLTVYIILTAIALAGLYFIWQRGKAAGFVMRWTTQDILILAIMGVLLEVYDNLIGDQFVTPIITLLPAGDVLHDLALNDIPYMFLLMVGIALIRKPGVATAMVFLNFLLMQLLYPGSKSSVLWWPYGLYQGLLVDVYIVLRGPQIFAKPDRRSILDGFIMGAVRAVPAVTISSAIMGPLLTGETETFGNGAAAAIWAPVAIFIARSVGQTSTSDTTPQEERHDLVAPEVQQEGGVQ
jgi:hypothetical protein